MKRFFPFLLAIGTLLMLAKASSPSTKQAMQTERITLHINNHTLGIRLCDNASARALAQELERGDIHVALDDYGGFEKVGRLPKAFPRCDEPIDTVPGDVILYQGNMICLYYGHNSWNFTRLGKIEPPGAELKKLFGSGKVKATLTLTRP